MVPFNKNRWMMHLALVWTWPAQVRSHQDTSWWMWWTVDVQCTCLQLSLKLRPTQTKRTQTDPSSDWHIGPTQLIVWTTILCLSEQCEKQTDQQTEDRAHNHVGQGSKEKENVPASSEGEKITEKSECVLCAYMCVYTFSTSIFWLYATGPDNSTSIYLSLTGE